MPSPVRLFGEARRAILELGHLGPLAVLLVALPFAGALLLIAEKDPVLAFLRGHDLGLPVFVAAGVLLAAASLVPTHAISIVAGFVWGPGLGSVLAMGIVLAAACLGFGLLSRLAGDRFLRMLAQRPRSEAVRAALLSSGGQRAAFVTGLVRLSPVMPFAGTNLLMAASGLRLGPFLIGSAIGLAPRVLALVFASAGLSHLSFDEPGQGALAIVGIVATLLGLIVLGLFARRALRDQLRGLDQKS